MNTLALAFAFGIAAGPTVTSNTPQDDFITPAAGKIVIMTDDLPTEAIDMGRILKPAAKKSDAYRIEGEHNWTVNVVAVLKKEAKGSVHVVFYDKDDKAALKNHEPVKAIEVHPAAHNKLLQVPNVQFNADMGFAVGHTYIVRVTELDAGNREVVLAESVMVLAKEKPSTPEPEKNEGGGDNPQ